MKKTKVRTDVAPAAKSTKLNLRVATDDVEASEAKADDDKQDGTQVSKVMVLGLDAERTEAWRMAADAKGWALDFYESTLAMGFLGRLREYAAVIVHENLQPISGLELAEYLENLLPTLPMILLSAEAREQSVKSQARSIVAEFNPDQEATDLVTQLRTYIDNLSSRLPLKAQAL